MLTHARSNKSQKVNVAMRLQFSFTGTQNYNLLRHRTSVCGHQKINNVTKFVTTSGNTCRSCLSWFYDGQTVNFGLQNSFFLQFSDEGESSRPPNKLR